MTFGDRLRKMRLERGLTQEQLAQQIGVAKSTLTGYEKGNREPDVFKIKRILEVLDMDSDYLLGISRKNKKSPATEEPSAEDDRERKRLLKNYDDLNEEGREKLLEQSEFLVSSGKYKRNIKNNPPNLGKEA